MTPPPHNIDMERRLIGAFLMDSEVMREILDLLPVEAFYSPQFGRIFKAAKITFKRHGSSLAELVADVLIETGEIDNAGGFSEIANCINSAPSIANWRAWLQVIIEDHKSRQLLRLAASIPNRLDDGQALRTDLDGILTTSAAPEFRSVADGVTGMMERLLRASEGESTGIMTGFSGFDAMTGGLKPGQLVIVAARPSIGKTALSMNMAANIAMSHRQIPVGVFSLEMGFDELVDRLLFSESRISIAKAKTGLNRSELERVSSTASIMSACPIYIDDIPRQTVSQIRSKSFDMQRRFGIGLLVIDYIQIMKGEGNSKNSNREQEVAGITKGLKALAKELRIPIIALAQLNRAAEGKERPTLAQLRESGELEQSADVIAFIHRDRQAQQVIRSGESVSADIIVEKNRSGACGVSSIVFTPEFCRFDNCTIKEEDSI
jgi:replicative DNA helicase